MKIGVKKISVKIDTAPLYSGHRIRGIGFYTERLLKELKKFRDLEIREKGYDILHIPYFSPFFITLPLFKKKPLVVTVHDLIPVKYPTHYPSGIKGKISWEVQKKLLKNADAIITDSNASRKDIIKYIGIPEDKIYVVYLAAGEEFRKLKTENCKLKIKQKYHLPDIFALYVGDVNWNKNVPSLVKACQEIKVPLVIVGKQAVAKDYDRTHPENKDLIWLQKRIDGKSIIALGFVETKDLVAIYNLATVYCQPSFDEGFGLSVLEAMNCGCPVVCSHLGSLPEIANGAAILVEPTVDGLVTGIEKAIEEKERLVRLGFAWSKNFSWPRTARETEAIYKALS